MNYKEQYIVLTEFSRETIRQSGGKSCGMYIILFIIFNLKLILFYLIKKSLQNKSEI